MVVVVMMMVVVTLPVSGPAWCPIPGPGGDLDTLWSPVSGPDWWRGSSYPTF